MKKKVETQKERTKYFDYHPSWLERLIEKSFPELIRKKYEPPYRKLWQEVRKNEVSSSRKLRKNRRRSIFRRKLVRQYRSSRRSDRCAENNAR